MLNLSHSCAGAAKEAAWKLSPLVPATLHPADCRLTDVLLWEQQITKGPVQVWHQATSALLSLLPHSFLTHHKLHHKAASPKQAEAPEAAANSGKWLLMSYKSGWQNPWQMCVRVAEALPSLVPDVAQEAGLNRERDLVRIALHTTCAGEITAHKMYCLFPDLQWYHMQLLLFPYCLHLVELLDSSCWCCSAVYVIKKGSLHKKV